MKKQRKKPQVTEDQVLRKETGSEAVNDTRFLDILETDFLGKNSSRRDFLKVFGYSLASAAILSSCKRPVQNAIPYVIQPPEITPGKSLYYATSFFDGHEYAGIVVKTREGRPIKIEGNSLSPFNHEGTSARVQASVLSLYDDARLKGPSVDNKPAGWDEIDKKIITDLESINSKGGNIVLLTAGIISPTTIKLINQFGAAYKNFKWIRYDPVSCSAIPEANALCFGREVIPDYHFGNAEAVVSVNADFLGSWVAPVHFIPAYVSRRKLDNGEKDMIRHIHFESGMSLTGSNADKRIKIRPSEEKILLTDLYNRIAEKTGADKVTGSVFREDLSWLAERLIESKGKSIVVSGTNNIDIQIIVNAINYLLGNYSDCIDLNNYLNIASGTDAEMDAFVSDLYAGKVNALIMYNVNPLYDFPDAGKFLTGLKNSELTVNMTVKQDETVGKAKYECPVHHYLESWDDCEIIPGQLSLAQPCINPLFNTRSFQDSLLKWSGKSESYHDYLMAAWEKEYFPRSATTGFRNFWNMSLRNGVFSYSIPPSGQPIFDQKVLKRSVGNVAGTKKSDFEIVITESVALGTGKHSNNPWLMELPDPVARQCWENVAAISPFDAEKHGIITGTMVKLTEGLILPAFIQPGQAEGTISVSLGYGHTGSGPVCNNIGVNLYPFVRRSEGTLCYSFGADKLENTLKVVQLALTQVHYSMEGRPIVRETGLSKYRIDPASGNEMHAEFNREHKTLYPDVKHKGFHWGLVIDLNSCVGCNACVIACQAENNIPVVGKDQVTRRRIMHWIKIDRYYSDNQDNPRVYFQPLACQHCDNAPCENVCPVSATSHSSEGLNQVTYNRCVGTKYCINNCPYKVRRFNWYRYTNNKAFDFNTSSELGRMVLNPDVTVRERGVVEKCSFCVQRIQEKKLQAKLENRKLAENDIKTACMQACPAGAIVFGNLNDPGSKVSKLFRDPRCYHLLEELHTLPNTGFLTRVWNDDIMNS